LSVINNAIRWLLDNIYFVVGSYSLAVIVLTIMFKCVMLPVSLQQRRSAVKQKRLQPMLDEIQKKYANDKERLAQKQMELYKKEKFNPLSGCIGLLITWPIFIALFGVMRTLGNEQMVHIYQIVAEGGTFIPEAFLWIRNVWQPDNIWDPVVPTMQAVNALRPVVGSAYLTQAIIDGMKANYETVMAPIIERFTGFANGWFILPILAGAIQFGTSKINPAMQAQASAANQQNQTMKAMTTVMPLMFVFFCATSNAIFALYWTVSALFDFLLQLLFKYLDERKAQREKLAFAAGSREP
jgi:YidC/Oxa1 family membrane protein insertase